MYYDRCHISGHSLKKLSKIDIFMLVSIFKKKNQHILFLRKVKMLLKHKKYSKQKQMGQNWFYTRNVLLNNITCLDK